MFTSFNISDQKAKGSAGEKPASSSRTRRKPVSVACENCRKGRIKCDNQRPCRHCKCKNLDCVRLDGANVPALIQQIQHLVGKVQALEGRVQQTQTQLPSPPSFHSSPEIDDVHRISNQTEPALMNRSGNSSTFEFSPTPHDILQPLLDLSSERFTARVDRLVGRNTSHTKQSVPITFSLDSRSQLRPSQHASTCLSKTLQDYYIRLYWRKIHRTLPVIERDVFEAHYKSLWDSTSGDHSRRNSHMVDIVLALALQLEYSSKPQDPRIEGMDQLHESDQHENLRLTARGYYDSCAATLNREYESPSLNVLQGYILMVVYLRNEQRHNSAYQILGFAIRAANILGLHQRARSDTTPEQLAIREQIVDFLFCFDVQQFLEFGRPYGIPDQSAKKHEPLRGSDTRCFWSYYSELLAITKHAHSTFRSNVHLDLDESSITDIHTQMEHSIPHFINAVANWASRVPPRFQFKRNFLSSPFCTEAPVEIDVDQPLWKLCQCLRLELSHHWVIMGVLRWFITPGSDPIQGSSYAHANRAVESSLAIVEVINHAHSETEAVVGWQDSQIILWDATITLIYCVLCQSPGPLIPKVLVALTKSETLFSAIGTKFSNTAAMSVREILSSQVHAQRDLLPETNIESCSISSEQFLPDFFDTPLQFSGEFLGEEPLAGLDLPMDLDLMAMQMPELSQRPIV